VSRPQPRGDRFTRSAQEPGPRSRHLHAGHRLANRQALARLIPGHKSSPGFDVTRFLSTRHQWFAYARLRDPHLPRSTARLFPRRSPPRLLTAAARGGLRPPPARRPRRATRPEKDRLLHLLHSTASSDLIFYIQPPSTFVFTPSVENQERRPGSAAAWGVVHGRAEYLQNERVAPDEPLYLTAAHDPQLGPVLFSRQDRRPPLPGQILEAVGIE
jgi:hypothetical protein